MKSFRSPLVAGLALAFSAAACSGNAPTSAPVSPAAATGTPDLTAACQTASTPADLTGWDVASQQPAAIPIVISQGHVCGENRLMFTFSDREQNTPIASPDRPARVAFYNLADSTTDPVSTVDAEFIWAIPDERGIYVAGVDFGTAGVWGAEFQLAGSDGSTETSRFVFTVQPDSMTVGVGDKAPPSDTPTLDDVGGDISLLSTDPEPVEAFYQTSVADALAARDPFVLVFATPQFCVSAQCGPTLDRIKEVAARNPELTIINVEPYELELVEGRLQPVLTNSNLTPVESVITWGITAEPWAYVVDDRGTITGSFALIFSDDEIQKAIDAATAPA